MTVQEAKAGLRRERRALRRAVAARRDRGADGAALAQAAVALLEARGLGPGATVTAYEATALEPPTAAVVAALQHRGVRVLLPITLPDLDLDWFDAADPQRAALGHGLLATVDLVLSPGLAVDASGARLGQGGGCYDRTLPRLRPGTPVVVLLHPEEVGVAPLPVEPHDEPVDAVLTADGLEWVPRSAHLYSDVNPPR